MHGIGTVAAFVFFVAGTLRTTWSPVMDERGEALISFDKAKTIARRALEKSRIDDGPDPGITWGRLRLPTETGTGHFAIVGIAGAGKTLMMAHLMYDVISRMGKGEGKRAVIFDYKGNAAEMVRAMNPNVPLFVLSPSSPEFVQWDISDDVDSDEAARLLAAILVPKEQTTVQFYENAPQILVEAVFKAFLRKCKTRKSKWTIRDLLLAFKDGEHLQAVIGDCEEAMSIAGHVLTDPNTLPSVLSGLSIKLGRLRTLAAIWDTIPQKGRQDFSVKKWTQSEVILLLPFDPKRREGMEAMNGAIFGWLTTVVLASTDADQTKKGGTQNWFFLDELRELGRLDTLSSFLNAGRSKGCCVCLGFQSIEGLYSVYGENLAKEIVGQCRSTTVLNSSPETAVWASEKVFGSFEGIRYDLSRPHQAPGREKTTTINAAQLRKTGANIDEELEFLAYHNILGIGKYSTLTPLEKLLKAIPKGIKPILETSQAQTEHELRTQTVDLRPWDEKDAERLGIRLPKTATTHAPPSDTGSVQITIPTEQVPVENDQPTQKPKLGTIPTARTFFRR